MDRCKVFQHVSTGRISARFTRRWLLTIRHLKTHFVEQYLAQLLGGCDIKRPTDDLMDARLKSRHFLRKRIRHPAQRIAVHLNAVHFHLGQHRHQRTLQRLINSRDILGMQQRLEYLPKAQRNISILSCIFHRIINRHTVKRDRRFPRAQQRLDRNGRMTQIPLRQQIHAMIMQAAMHRIRHQHCVIYRMHGDPNAGKNLGIVFHILANFQDALILQHRL